MPNKMPLKSLNISRFSDGFASRDWASDVSCVSIFRSKYFNLFHRASAFDQPTVAQCAAIQAPAMTKASITSERERLLLWALQEGVGPALVLDRELRILFGTPQVADLIGRTVPVGERAPSVLCGRSAQRPVAEALARGEAAKAEITRVTPQGERIILVTTHPLAENGRLLGHVLFLRSRGEILGTVTRKHGILTGSEAMKKLLRTVERVAPSDASVLVRGETGSGKELIARAIHSLSQRKDKPFLAINCAALPEQLLESELFGHQRGAFTGAVRDTEGMFRRANGGTLFLDEVAELPLPVQAKLLRVTQERQVLPLGGTRAIPVDVRIVSATHRSLRQEVEAGRFRADLMYRLRVIPLFLPALRERKEDIEPLANLFLEKLSMKGQRCVESISPAALRTLSAHDWPGNVRELQNVIEYAYLMGEGTTLAETDLPAEVRAQREAAMVNSGADAYEGDAARIFRALERASGNRQQAADSLGISRSTLWRRMKEYGIDDEHIALARHL